MKHTIATLGIVKPILASADPSDRFKLVWSLLFLAAMIAAIPSGNKIIAAITTPTKDTGKLRLITILSIVGESVFANNTTICFAWWCAKE